MRAIKALFRLLFAKHLALCLSGIAIVTFALAARVVDRTSFADSDMKRDVMERWGAPIEQPAPSVRYVTSGAVFSELRPLALDRQQILVDASMNYRRRGLVYFSGFDFALTGEFEVHNPESTDIDLAFVFPIQMRRNQVLLSDLTFQVNGKPAPVELSEDAESSGDPSSAAPTASGTDKLLWTGRARPGEKLVFSIAYRGRGLDSFVWRLDPSLRVSDFRMTFHFHGGSNFDYPPEVVPAGKLETASDGATLTWTYPSLESGVPVGLVLPSQQSWDEVIAKASGRAWSFFLLLFLGTLLLFTAQRREMRLVEAGLLAASYAIVFPLLAYLAAAMPFWAATVLAVGAGSAQLVALAWLFLSREAARVMAGLAVLALWVPMAAAVAEGYSGLVYTLEAAALLAAA
ncbi:MAG: hypothetical protein HY901_07095, partial [Deltaproteobacteria bacterium]|nr:hypothetical protein [Deltaproteobacteria bacterium]